MGVRAQLSADEVARFRREGCTFIPRLLDGGDLGLVRDAFENMATAGGYMVDQFARRLVVTRNLWRRVPGIELVVRRLAPLAGQLMDEDQVRLVDDAALVKPARRDGGDPTNWHQDAPNFPFDRRGFLTIWIAVTDIELEQGPLTLLPGSHRLGLLGAVDGAGDGLRLDDVLTAEDRAYIGEPVTTALRAGDATVHDGSLLHSAGPNRTDRPRRAWGVRFIPAETLYTGAAHQLFDGLGLEPFEPFEHEYFPLISRS